LDDTGAALGPDPRTPAACLATAARNDGCRPAISHLRARRPMELGGRCRGHIRHDTGRRSRARGAHHDRLSSPRGAPLL